jgi:hypothetical protein
MKKLNIPVIHEQGLRHEGFPGVYPMEWCALVREICLRQLKKKMGTNITQPSFDE